MKVLFISLGCDKNLVDTEEMLGILGRDGYSFTDDETQADVIIVNSCCFINDAKEESINTILEMAECKKNNVCKALIVTGCLAQRYKDEILKEIPEVDGILGTANYDSISSIVSDCLKNNVSGNKDEFFCLDRLPKLTKRVVTTGGYYAHLKIADGCNKNCTYCIIPKIRGSYRSFPMEELVEQAKELVESGVKELILVAQETTVYGIDLYGEKSLHKLLKKLCEIDGLRFIRIMYCYPEEIYDELIEVMKSEPKICHYLDIPIQHASDDILRRMGRRTNKQKLIDIISKLRYEIPDIALRTTLISGFPGETEDNHEELLSFVDEMEFDRLGVFAYSAEEGTVAAGMENQIDDEIKENRRDEIMGLQQEIAFEKSSSMVGKELIAIIDGKLPEENAYVGRTYMDAPNIDGNIFINTNEELMSGNIVKVKVTGSYEYDLIGELIN
ncbi:MAG: 30S ribosomal protein S12 methylthiotransferase RimO [Lachnospiraceae bacterium]|nr:30S ribosomal protein S12 methylthiotransferase RimO [Lachnospiraceae bacterium]